MFFHSSALFVFLVEATFMFNTRENRQWDNKRVFIREWLLCASPNPDFPGVAMETRHERERLRLCEWIESAGQSDPAKRTEGQVGSQWRHTIAEAFTCCNLSLLLDEQLWGGLSTGQPLCFHFTIISDASLAFLVKPFCINVTVVEVKTSWQFLIMFPGIQQTHLIFISQPYWNMEVRSILTPLGWCYLIPHSNASVYWAVDVGEGVFNGSGS